MIVYLSEDDIKYKKAVVKVVHNWIKWDANCNGLHYSVRAADYTCIGKVDELVGTSIFISIQNKLDRIKRRTASS